MTGTDDMNEREATAYVAALTQTVPDSDAPLGDLLVGGAAARARHRRRQVVGSVLAVALVAGGIGVGTVVAGGRPSPDGDTAPADQGQDTVDLTPGTRLVGAALPGGTLTLEVPDSWRTSPAQCRTSGESVLATPGPVECVDPQRIGTYGASSVESVVVAPVDSDAGAAIRRSLGSSAPEVPVVTRSTAHGVEVEIVEGLCTTLVADFEAPGESYDTSTCTATLVVPGLEAAVNVTADGAVEVAAVVESLRALPAGRTLVPGLSAGTTATEAVDVMASLGLDAGSASPGAVVTRTEPAAGSVVATGSVVELTTRDTLDLQPVVVEDGGTGFAAQEDLDGVAPRTPEEAGAWQDATNATRIPAYAEDGETIVGTFEIGARAGNVVTALVAPSRAEPMRADGTLTWVDGCTYLVDGADRQWVIWSWPVQAREPIADAPALEDLTTGRLVAVDGQHLSLDGLLLPGQQVVGGPCRSDGPPLYVGIGAAPLAPEPSQPSAAPGED